MRVSPPSALVTWCALVSIAGCYESATPTDTVDGGGVAVTVLANTYTQVGYRSSRVAVSGAFVVARRCGSMEQHEARTNAVGVALLAFEAIDCWTVTAVHPSLPYAASRVAVNPATDGPLILVGDGSNPPSVDLFSSMAMGIDGRALAGSDVTLIGDGVLLGRGRSFAAGGWHTTISTVDVFGVPGAPPPLTIYAVEVDATKMPIGFGRISFDSTSDSQAIDVGMIRGPILARSHTITVASGGALALGILVPNSASAYRTLADDWWSLSVGRGAFGPVEQTASATTHHVQMRELDIESASEGLLGTKDTVSFGNSFSPSLSITLDPGIEEVVIPPLDSAHIEITSASGFDVAIGGPGYIGTVFISHDNGTRERSSNWTIGGARGLVMRLTALPPLPSARGLGALRLSGLRGAQIHVGAWGTPGASDGGTAPGWSWSVGLPGVTIAP